MKMNPKLIFGSPPGDKSLDDQRRDWLVVVAHELKIKHSVWSVESPQVDDFNLVPFPTARQFLYDGGTWGKPQHRRIAHPLTWGEIWKACDVLIGKAGDLDHRFIETVECERDGTITFFCGS